MESSCLEGSTILPLIGLAFHHKMAVKQHTKYYSSAHTYIPILQPLNSTICVSRSEALLSVYPCWQLIEHLNYNKMLSRSPQWCHLYCLHTTKYYNNNLSKYKQGKKVSLLEFNVRFQHKYGYIRDKRSGVESYPYAVKKGQRYNLNPGWPFVQQPPKRETDGEPHLNYYASAYNKGRQLLHRKTKINQIQQNTKINLN